MDKAIPPRGRLHRAPGKLRKTSARLDNRDWVIFAGIDGKYG